MYIPSYWREQAEQVAAEALQRGKAEGKAEGKHDGEALALIAALRTKFGDLPPKVVNKIMQADEQKLLHWITQIFTAQSLDELFN